MIAYLHHIASICLHEYKRLSLMADDSSFTADEEGRLSALIWRIEHTGHELTMVYEQRFGLKGQLKPGPTVGEYGPALTDEQKQRMHDEIKALHAKKVAEKEERDRLGAREYLKNKVEAKKAARAKQ